MRPLVRAAGLALVLGAALSTSACVTPSEPDPEPSPTTTPLFASDEEALAAAEEAYERYIEVTDQIFAEGGVGLERLNDVVTGRQLEANREGLEFAATEGHHSIGRTTFRDAKFQSQTFADGVATVMVYLCQDISGVDVVDQRGNSIVSPTRPNEVRYEVTLQNTREMPETLLVESQQVWSGGECEP